MTMTYQRRLALDALVELRLLEWRAHPESRPDPEQHIPCLECRGTGQLQHTACDTCEGSGRLVRKHAWAQYLAAHGDELQYGGKCCTRAFNVLADMLATLILHLEHIYRDHPAGLAYHRAKLMALGEHSSEVEQLGEVFASEAPVPPVVPIVQISD
jgi:RecJ-like exonuclease